MKTKTRKPVQKKSRFVHIEDRDGATLRLVLTVNGKATFYSVDHLHHGSHEAFLWLKGDTKGTTHKTEFYNDGNFSCTCEYFENANRGRCKHTDSLMALRNRGHI